MDKIIAWIKKEIVLQFRLALTNLKIKAFFLPLYIIIQLVTYFYFRNSLFENGFWVIATPMLVTLAILIPYLLTKRSNPNWTIYYFFHPTTFIKIAIFIAVLALIGLFFYAQCREFGGSIGLTCIKQIFGGK